MGWRLNERTSTKRSVPPFDPSGGRCRYFDQSGASLRGILLRESNMTFGWALNHPVTPTGDPPL